MNFIHKSIAKKVIHDILNYDLQLIKSGNSLKILALESNFENVEFFLNEEKQRKLISTDLSTALMNLTETSELSIIKPQKPKI
jgi:hypothetical protein